MTNGPRMDSSNRQRALFQSFSGSLASTTFSTANNAKRKIADETIPSASTSCTVPCKTRSLFASQGSDLEPCTKLKRFSTANIPNGNYYSKIKAKETVEYKNNTRFTTEVQLNETLELNNVSDVHDEDDGADDVFELVDIDYEKCPSDDDDDVVLIEQQQWAIVIDDDDDDTKQSDDSDVMITSSTSDAVDAAIPNDGRFPNVGTNHEGCQTDTNCDGPVDEIDKAKRVYNINDPAVQAIDRNIVSTRCELPGGVADGLDSIIVIDDDDEDENNIEIYELAATEENTNEQEFELVDVTDSQDHEQHSPAKSETMVLWNGSDNKDWNLCISQDDDGSHLVTIKLATEPSAK